MGIKVFSNKNQGEEVALINLQGGKKIIGCPKCGYGFLGVDKLLKGSEKCPECNTKLDWAKVKFESKIFY